MAVRKRTYQTDKTREKIRTTELKNRLEAYALGLDDPKSKKPVSMESGQVKAALGLLAKTLPDLTSADIHDSRQSEPRTYEDIRLELIREHGEPMALLLLKEISQGDYLKMVQVKQTMTVKDTDKPDTMEHGVDVSPAHAQLIKSPDPGVIKPQ